MPDESCRGCGGVLAKCTICAECRMPVSLICMECGMRTSEQIHAVCFMAKIPKIQEVNAGPSGIYAKQVLA
jgi:predicted amidophosphoribosyltransferase